MKEHYKDLSQEELEQLPIPQQSKNRIRQLAYPKDDMGNPVAKPEISPVEEEVLENKIETTNPKQEVEIIEDSKAPLDEDIDDPSTPEKEISPSYARALAESLNSAGDAMISISNQIGNQSKEKIHA